MSRAERQHYTAQKKAVRRASAPLKALSLKPAPAHTEAVRIFSLACNRGPDSVKFIWLEFRDIGVSAQILAFAVRRMQRGNAETRPAGQEILEN